MKKLTKYLILLVVGLIFMGVNSEDTWAASKQKIKVGKVYHINIDGKRGKEKILVKRGKELYEGMGWYYYSLYINNRKVKTIDAMTPVCAIIDIDEKTKGKEILFYGTETDGILSDGKYAGGIFQYRNSKLKTLGSLMGDYKNYHVTRILNIYANGNGIVTINADTPTEVNIGCYYGKIKLKVKNGKLVPIKTQELVLHSYSRSYQYVLGKNTFLYKKASKASGKIKKLKKGTTLTISKVVFSGIGEQFGSYGGPQAKNVYAYVQDDSGNKGWIYVPKMKGYFDTDNFFEQYPAWG